MDPLTSADGNVEVMIPLDLRNASIVRVVAAALGADSGYSMDEIDDFRLALNEAFALLVDASPAPARAHITFTPGDGELTATRDRLQQEGIRADSIEIGRFKGLGEMNPEQLRETTMATATRRVLPVRVRAGGLIDTQKMFTLLMGKGEAASRRAWMEAKGDTVEADI